MNEEKNLRTVQYSAQNVDFLLSITTRVLPFHFTLAPVLMPGTNLSNPVGLSSLPRLFVSSKYMKSVL